jgi:hypothetical protein
MTPEIIVVSDNDFSPKMLKDFNCVDALTRFYSALYGRANCGDFTKKIFPSSYATGVNQSPGLFSVFFLHCAEMVTAFVRNRPLTLTKVTV